jgi:hypothetical protein
MNLVSRLNVPDKLSLERYLKLPVGSEIILLDKAPLEFLEKDLMFRVARERQYTIRKVDRHPIREFFKE